jgi:hypothetical protein
VDGAPPQLELPPQREGGPRLHLLMVWAHITLVWRHQRGKGTQEVDGEHPARRHQLHAPLRGVLEGAQTRVVVLEDKSAPISQVAVPDAILVDPHHPPRITLPGQPPPLRDPSTLLFQGVEVHLLEPGLPLDQGLDHRWDRRWSMRYPPAARGRQGWQTLTLL